MTKFDNLEIDHLGKLREIIKDPLDLITKNKKFVDYLRTKGMTGTEIRNILDNWQGLEQEFPILMTKQDMAKQRQVDYARRHIKALVRNEAITDKERNSLLKIFARVSEEYLPKGKSGKPAVRLMYHPNERKSGYAPAKTFKQMVGFQTVPLYDLIQGYNGKMFLEKDIFNLIAEIFEVAGCRKKFTQKQIKNFYTNNL